MFSLFVVLINCFRFLFSFFKDQQQAEKDETFHQNYVTSTSIFHGVLLFLTISLLLSLLIYLIRYGEHQTESVGQSVNSVPT